MCELPGPEPTGPELLPIRAIHRHDDGVISFHRKNADGGFENLFAIRSEHLEGMFPEFRAQLEADSYFSVNAFWHRERGRQYLKATEARRPERLRYLCAAYCDLDSYKSGVEFGTALGVIVTYQDEGVIPPASVIARSGRGLWLLWFLRDTNDPALPPPAFPEKIRAYLEINRAAGERLAQLGADAAARDSLRLTRVPGSFHGGVCRRVKYWIQVGSDGQPATYTLEDLAAAFKIEDRLDRATGRAFDEAALPRGSHLRGHAQLNARRLREFELLRSMRGGFLDGCRNHAAVVYAWLLSRSGMDRATVLGNVQGLARGCRPPLDSAAVNGAVKTAFGRTMRRVGDQTISDWLGITPGEAELLEKMPAASRFRVIDPPSLIGPPLDAEQRRNLIRQFTTEFGSVPTSRRMAEMLGAKGYSISYRQVQRDYRALGIASGRERSAEQLTFPD